MVRSLTKRAQPLSESAVPDTTTEERQVRHSHHLQTLDVIPPRRLPCPTRDREYRYHKPLSPSPSGAHSGDCAQVPANAHLTFDPVILFEVTFPDPAGMAPIQVTAQGPRAFLKTAPNQSIHSLLTLPYLSISQTNLYLIHWACRSDGRPAADRAMPRKSEPFRQWSALSSRPSISTRRDHKRYSSRRSSPISSVAASTSTWHMAFSATLQASRKT